MYSEICEIMQKKKYVYYEFIIFKVYANRNNNSCTNHMGMIFDVNFFHPDIESSKNQKLVWLYTY